jgi:hypothetical protein
MTCSTLDYTRVCHFSVERTTANEVCALTLLSFFPHMLQLHACTKRQFVFVGVILFISFALFT